MEIWNYLGIYLKKYQKLLEETEKMDKKKLTELFEPIFGNYNKHFINNLRALYPLDANSGTTFNEANFTSNFIKSLYLGGAPVTLATWDEFPVPKGTRRDDPQSGGMIDSLIIDHENKRIFLLEAKRLRQLNKQHPFETVADTKNDSASLISDMARAVQVANSDILSKRIWKAGRLFEPLGDRYDDYRVYGLALCGIWTKDHRYNEVEVEDAFLAGGRSLVKQNPAFDVIDFNDGVTFVKEINGAFPQTFSYLWQFFTLLYAWEIERNQTLFKSLDGCLDVDAVGNEIKQLQIVIDERLNWWYLFPSRFVGAHIIGNENKNKLWIIKRDPSCRLYAYAQNKRTIRLPDGFTKDENNSNWVYMPISLDSFVEELRRIFEEIIKLNP